MFTGTRLAYWTARIKDMTKEEDGNQIHLLQQTTFVFTPARHARRNVSLSKFYHETPAFFTFFFFFLLQVPPG